MFYFQYDARKESRAAKTLEAVNFVTRTSAIKLAAVISTRSPPLTPLAKSVAAGQGSIDRTLGTGQGIEKQNRGLLT